MGIVIRSVHFEGTVPTVEEIVGRVSDVSGLEVSITEGPVAGPADSLRVAIAFTVRRDDSVELLRSGRRVHLEISIGQEATLFFATLVALEALGGQPDRPLSDRERAYALPVTEAELARRRREMRKRSLMSMGLAVPILILTSPVWIAKRILSFPRRALRLYRAIKQSDK